MIHYTSTRGHPKKYTFSQTVLKGIAEDGGLFIPERLPKLSIDEIAGLAGQPYPERAQFIFERFETGLPEPTIRRIVHQAYGDNFDTPGIAPLVHLKANQYLLELWHGPTAAFKDMALQIMPLFFSEAAKVHNTNRQAEGNSPHHYLILVATSGDTGKAALEGFRDNEHAAIIVFYPDGHVSQLQERQMVTQEGENVAVYAVQGDFDAVQSTVKEIFNDQEFNRVLLERHNTVLSSANSINWGRLMPQIVYHLSSYADLIDQGVISAGESIDIAVPTGNFGNILAAYYARRIGLPVRKLICASNANNVLTEFLQTGVYDIEKRELLRTPSPSMDILIASNIERLVHALTGDPQQVAEWMAELRSTGAFELPGYAKSRLQQEFFADWVSNADSLANIRQVFQETGQLLDPHTSVAQLVTERYLRQENMTRPVVICATAHWAKFARDVYTALNPKDRQDISDEFAILTKIQEIAPDSDIPIPITGLSRKRIRFTQRVKADRTSIRDLVSKDILA